MAIIGFLLCFAIMCYFTFAGIVIVIYGGQFGDSCNIRIRCGTVVGLSSLWYLLITNAPFTVTVGG